MAHEMTEQEQLAEVEKWENDLQAVMDYGISKGRPGWRGDSFLFLYARLQERLARALREPTPEHTASAAACVFMAFDKLRIETEEFNRANGIVEAS